MRCGRYVVARRIRSDAILHQGTATTLCPCLPIDRTWSSRVGTSVRSTTRPKPSTSLSAAVELPMASSVTAEIWRRARGRVSLPDVHTRCRITVLADGGTSVAAEPVGSFASSTGHGPGTHSWASHLVAPGARSTQPCGAGGAPPHLAPTRSGGVAGRQSPNPVSDLGSCRGRICSGLTLAVAPIAYRWARGSLALAA
jgi:hypothetical protein